MPRQASEGGKKRRGGGQCTMRSPQGTGIPVPFHALEVSRYGWPSRSVKQWRGGGGVQLAAQLPPRSNIRQNVGA